MLDGSPVTKIEEIYFKPKHPSCSAHWTFRAHFFDGRSFAVNFTDRQLGWVPLVFPWETYAVGRVAELEHEEELGWVYDRHYEDHHLRHNSIVAPPFDMVLGVSPAGWVPAVMNEEERKHAEWAWDFRCEPKMKKYFAAWKKGVWR